MGYVRENKLQLILVHYIDSSKAPINKMFKVFDKSTVEKVKSIIASYRGQADRIGMKTNNIGSFFGKQERTEEHTFVLPLPSPPPVTASPQATLDLRKFLGMKKKTPSPRKKRVVKRKIDVKIPMLDTFFSSKD